jgi:hypothetical protein
MVLTLGHGSSFSASHEQDDILGQPGFIAKLPTAILRSASKMAALATARAADTSSKDRARLYASVIGKLVHCVSVTTYSVTSVGP